MHKIIALDADKQNPSGGCAAAGSLLSPRNRRRPASLPAVDKADGRQATEEETKHECVIEVGM